MTEPARLSPAVDLVDVTSTTPTGTQSTAELSRRRWFMFGVNVTTYLGMIAWMAEILGTEGWSIVDLVLLVCFLVSTPWTVLGFWNAVVGLWLLHGREDGLAQVAPFAIGTHATDPVWVRTAILMTLRNEDPARAMVRLETVKRSVDETGFGAEFGYFILSDSSDPAVIAAEEEAVAAWRRAVPDPERITYRRRDQNTGFKAGNVREFCETHGRDYELMLPLDADSLMSGAAILRLVRIMQAHPRLGILQSLVVGAPSKSAFARIFQFGMRHGMRAYTMGSAWWIGECGPFWGHNALVRIAPFMEHCHLPILPGGPPLGGHVLSHDQVEATLMRKAGYEVRVMPEENGSWEENPPTLFDFSTRDLRWCQGNMQYWKLIDFPGLLPMSRFQLAWAILMFVGVPAMTLMIALAPVKFFDGEAAEAFPAGLAIGLYVTFLLMYLSPKLAGLADILLTKGGVDRYGGRRRFLASAAIEIVFSFLLGAVTTFRIAVFMIGLVFGRSVVWNGQARDAHGVAWTTALRGLWAPFGFGCAICAALGILSPATFLWSLPLTFGYLVAFPFAVITASPKLGKLLARAQLCAIPEELDMPEEIRAVRQGA
jgi:membrane glycosyltransferase